MSGFMFQPQVLRNRRPVAGSAAATTWGEWMAAALRVLSTRNQLAEMDDRMLKDIGLTRADALTELARAPWDVSPRGF